MSLHKLTAGDGYTYLTRQVAVQDATDRGASGLAEYYAEKGESPGRWWGSGMTALDVPVGSTVSEAQMKRLFGEGRHPDAGSLGRAPDGDKLAASVVDRTARLGQPFRVTTGATDFTRRLARLFVDYNGARGIGGSEPIPPGARARLRTELADEIFVEQHGRPPADARERHGFITRESRQRTCSVAGFDLTFTPVKSVSVVWALASPDVAHEVEAAHAAAVQSTLSWLEQNALFTRRGHNGVQQVPAQGLIAAVFTHRDSRAGDPNLHTHVAVSNKVQDSSGHWLAIDARILYKANVSLSERYNTRLEAELTTRLGLRFEAATRDSRELRPVREVVGVDSRLMQMWSRRRSDIKTSLSSLTAGFQDTHGRPPSPSEALALAQQANLESRQAKHEPRAEAEQRHGWARQAGQVLGSRAAVSRMVAQAVGGRISGVEVSTSPQWVARTAREVVGVLEGSRATWQVWHVHAEAERQARYADIPLARLDAAVGALTSRVLDAESIALPDPDPSHRNGLTPRALRRRDGAPVHSVHGAARYTSRRILEAERTILDAASQSDGPAVSAERARAFMEARAASAGRPRLSREQQALVARLGMTPQPVQVALAPAGSGKTVCMRALADLWQSNGGTVVGLAPSAAAAQQLRLALGDDAPDGAKVEYQTRHVPACDTLAKLARAVTHPKDAPAWMSSIDASTMVIVDEAAMAGTLELAAVVRLVVERGGCARLVGDDRQLAGSPSATTR
ncbi:MobF family relaxase [Nocardioides sp. 31GB23]|uniref:MobF family relaxase n=1 Tax=Nocardioides sp. 31GB23 TaxID=3156065 RepID=UPI0032AF93EA